MTDSDGSSGSGQGTATVADAALTATGRATSLSSSLPGVAFSGSLGSFLDTDPNGATLAASRQPWTGAMATPPPAERSWMTAPVSCVSAAHAYAQPGDFTRLVTATDSGGASVSWSVNVVVAATTLSGNPAMPILTEGASTIPQRRQLQRLRRQRQHGLQHQHQLGRWLRVEQRHGCLHGFDLPGAGRPPLRRG